MLNISNLLSLSRAIFALAFLVKSPLIRLIAIFLAMLSDFLDGYLARRQRTTTQLGAILDPIMDKFFVLFAGIVFLLEGRILLWQLVALLSRDISLLIFGFFLAIVRRWKGYECKALWWGKITTVAQFMLLIGLTINFVFPGYIYLLFVAMASFAFLELIFRFRRLT